MTPTNSNPVRRALELTAASPALSALLAGTITLVGALLVIFALASSRLVPSPAPEFHPRRGADWSLRPRVPEDRGTPR
jgi:hypothetical protein